MKITSIKIRNFKAIKNVEIADISDAILIAGPNGCGKSCIFHAIRLLKSVIGGYQENEWHMWLNEFQIKPNNINAQIGKLFQTRDRELVIEATFTISEDERNFLIREGRHFFEFLLWKRVYPQLANQHFKARPIGVEFQTTAQEIREKSKPNYDNMVAELGNMTDFKATFKSDSQGDIKAIAPLVLQALFSIYDEENVGVIDYHGPHRDYQREELGQINLNIQTSKESMKQHSLYNYSNKYKNVKQELAGDFVRKVLKEKAGTYSSEEENTLIDTLKQLFEDFFPGKEFLGPVANEVGGIDFPVKLLNGKTHDINDLSSGEKEVLYGYLRLRYSAPRNSIIMLDEPELHLNPRLITGLPRFYKQNLGEILNNQLWLVTHSDEFLRQAVGEYGYQVYHMQASGTLSYSINQIKIVDANDDLEKAVIDLVGDLAAYSPSKKVILLEGENSEFDKTLITRLFPDVSEKVNLVSVGSKNKVHKLHELLEKATGSVRSQFYSIVDRDTDEATASDHPATALQWNVYHIENYLLNPKFLKEAVDQLTLGHKNPSIQEVKDSLVRCASESVNSLVVHGVTRFVWNNAFGDRNLRIDPNSSDPAKDIFDALVTNVDRLKEKTNDEFKGKIEEERERLTNSYQESINNGEWASEIRGRDILKKFAHEWSNGSFSYEVLRNTVISLMTKGSYQPPGMVDTLEKIEPIT